MTPKDLEEACKQPLIIASILSMVSIIPIHFLSMFALFTKLNQSFNPTQIALKQRQNRLSQRFSSRY